LVGLSMQRSGTRLPAFCSTGSYFSTMAPLKNNNALFAFFLRMSGVVNYFRP